MLILTRRPGESIIIEKDDLVGQENSEETVSGENKKESITITVLRVKGGQISLGINADRSFLIFREEIHPDKKRPNGNIAEPNQAYHDDYDASYGSDADYSDEDNTY